VRTALKSFSRPIYIEGFSEDRGMSINEQKHFVTSKAEEVLKQSDALFRALIENSSDIVVLINVEGIVTYVSPSITPIMGYTPEKIVGKHALVLVHPDDLDRMQILFQGIFQSPGKSLRAKYRLRCQDGSWRWFEGVGTNLLDDPQAGAIVGNFRDITERKRTEEALQEEGQRFRMIWEAASDAMALSDAQGRVLAANAAFYQLYGYKPEEVLGNTFAIIFSKEQQAWAETQYKIVFEGERGNVPIESSIQRADGTQRIVETSYDFLVHDGKRIAMISIIRDITERKELESRRDDFISMASHELKTPLTSLKGFSQLLKKRLKKQELTEPLWYLTKMETQIEKLTNLIAELLDISKSHAGKLEYREEVIDIDALVRELVENLQPTSSSHTIRITGTSQKKVVGDKDRLEQVFTNLITNAIKYSPEAANVAIQISSTQNTVIISVQDDGIGIPQEHQEKIFERFYRVINDKDTTFTGFGMGLYIVHEIVQRHKGKIWVESTEGAGSTFYVSLPTQE
jgi:two-component system, OmpR family, phosphate regulon sensor histidine kinase PhoR